MRRRPGFTLIEMLVSVALVLFIMVILTEAFGKGLESFRTLKAIGDMEARLRTAAAILRRDLTADHFEGKRRLSDPANRWNAMGVPREGFFVIGQNAVPLAAALEGSDSDGIDHRRQLDALYYTVKLRGNNRSDFFTATLNKGGTPSPLLRGVRTTFFDHPDDARFQDTPFTYSSQWAEVLVVPAANGASLPDGTPLHTLYRGQLLVVPDNSRLNWPSSPPTPGCPMPPAALDQHLEISCYPKVVNNQSILYFNNPSDLTTAANRTFLGLTAQDRNRTHLRWPLAPLLTDVLSFDVDFIRSATADLNAAENASLDTASRGNPIFAIRVRIRIWDEKTRQTRQMTIVQDM